MKKNQIISLSLLTAALGFATFVIGGTKTMTRLMLIDYKMGKPLERIELDELTLEGRQQVRHEAEEWIKEIDDYPNDEDEGGE